MWVPGVGPGIWSDDGGKVNPTHSSVHIVHDASLSLTSRSHSAQDSSLFRRIAIPGLFLSHALGRSICVSRLLARLGD